MTSGQWSNGLTEDNSCSHMLRGPQLTSVGSTVSERPHLMRRGQCNFRASLCWAGLTLYQSRDLRGPLASGLL